MTALLELENARIDRDGVPALEGLSFAATGARVGLVGDFGALFALLAGRATLVSGRASVLGLDAVSAALSGAVGLAARELRLPESWDVDRYLIEAARLGGAGARAARDAVRAVLASLDLGHLGGRRIGTLTMAERRGVALALAMLDDPKLLAVEDPVSDLDERGTLQVCASVERAAAGRTLVVSTRVAPRAGPEHALFAAADEVVVLEAGALVAQGPLSTLSAPGLRYLVAVTRHARALSEQLEAAGLSVALARSSELGEGARFVVGVPEAGSTAAILDAALAVQAPIVELVPLT